MNVFITRTSAMRYQAADDDIYLCAYGICVLEAQVNYLYALIAAGEFERLPDIVWVIKN